MEGDLKRNETVSPIGGLKVVAENGWFAARPSGTENISRSMRRASRIRAT